MTRRSGKTFRKLLRSLIAASEGENVAYHTNVAHLRKYYFNAACEIINSYLTDIAILKNDMRIVFPNNGSLRFVCESEDLFDKLRGIKIDKHIDDN